MVRIVLLALLLLAAPAHAITVSKTETRIENVMACMVKTGQADPQFLLYFDSYDASGELIRHVVGRDVWAQLNATQKSQIRTIINAVNDAIYSGEAIPTPTPTPIPTPTPTPVSTPTP